MAQALPKAVAVCGLAPAFTVTLALALALTKAIASSPDLSSTSILPASQSELACNFKAIFKLV